MCSRPATLLQGLEQLPAIQLSELVDGLDDLPMDTVTAEDLLRQPGSAVRRGQASNRSDQLAGLRAADSLSETLLEAGLTALSELLTFCGVREELPRILGEQPTTIFVPSNTALGQLSEATRADPKLLRQIVFAHMCAGRYLQEDLVRKHCAVSLDGQTHAVYLEGGGTHVGTARLGRTNLSFDGGVVHEIHSVLLVVQMIQDCHAEQVWKKSLQPAPTLSVCGGGLNLGLGGTAMLSATVEFEVHACLLHVATGQLVPESLEGHIRKLGQSLGESQVLRFSEIIVAAKPPSLTKRSGRAQPEGANRYRLLFSIWNSSTLSYVTWQHMQTPVVVRNSFHMLPAEEKAYRRQLYARARLGGGATSGTDERLDERLSLREDRMLPSLPEGGLAPLAGGEGVPMEDEQWMPLSQAGLQSRGEFMGRCRVDSYNSTDSVEDEDWSSLGGSMSRGGEEELQPPELALEPEEELQQLQAMAQSFDAHSPKDDGRTPPIFTFSSRLAPATPSASAPAPALATLVPLPEPPVASIAPQRPERAASEVAATSTSLAATVAGPPVLLDCSVREGGCRGGTAMWLHGKRFTPDMTVAFGGVPARQAAVVSAEVIKLVSPPCLPHNAHRRHQVLLGLVSRATGEQSSSSTLLYDYVPDGPAAAPAASPPLPPRPGLLEELLQRLLISLERAHATAIAAAEPAPHAPPAVPPTSAASLGDANAAQASGLALFQQVDERGYSLGDYVAGLRKMMESFGLTADSASHADASELQMQHRELAALVTRERLSASLANRPAPERLQERNILPEPGAQEQASARRELLSASLANRPAPHRLQERNILPEPGAAQQASARRELLSASLANRPAPDRLQERNILPAPEAQQQLAMKRKRLEGFLAERPPPERVEQVLWGGFGGWGRSPRNSNA